MTHSEPESRRLVFKIDNYLIRPIGWSLSRKIPFRLVWASCVQRKGASTEGGIGKAGGTEAGQEFRVARPAGRMRVPSYDGDYRIGLSRLRTCQAGMLATLATEIHEKQGSQRQAASHRCAALRGKQG